MTRLSLVSLLVLVAACGMGDFTFPSAANVCVTTDECGAGATCVQGRCISTDTYEPLTVTARVSVYNPAGVDTVASWTLPPETVVGTHAKDLVVPERIRIDGRVRFGSLRLPATISYVRARTPELVPDAAQQATTLRRNTELSFSVELFASIYDVRVQPLGATVDDPSLPAALNKQAASLVFPPLVHRQRALPLAIDGDAFDELVYPADLFSPCSLDRTSGCELSGRVVTLDGLGVESGLGGYGVFAVERGTGQRVSTVGTTGGNGEFAIRVTPGIGEYDVRIGPGAGAPVVPEVVIEPSAFLPGGAGHVILPVLPATKYRAEVEAPAGVAAPAVRVELSSTQLEIDGALVGGEFRTVVEALRVDGVCAFEVDLVPGRYDVVVRPLDAMGYAPLRRTILVVSTQSGVQEGTTFVLPPKGAMNGSIAMPSRAAAPFVRLQAVPYVPSSLPKHAVERFAGRVTAETDRDGYFGPACDAGYYDLLVALPTSSNFAAFVLPGLRVESGNTRRVPALVLPAPVIWSGRVLDFAGRPLPNAGIEYFLHVGEGADVRPVSLGWAYAGPDGAFEILLPPCATATCAALVSTAAAVAAP